MSQKSMNIWFWRKIKGEEKKQLRKQSIGSFGDFGGNKLKRSLGILKDKRTTDGSWSINLGLRQRRYLSSNSELNCKSN